MSGYTGDRGLAEELRDRGVRLIQKPFSTATLLQVVREVLDLVPPAGPSSAEASTTTHVAR
jgi:hypothetical protein